MKLKKDHVRNDILDAARLEFFSKGYTEANMRSIAERAHITPGNIYRYYASKEELLDSVVKHAYKGISSLTKLEYVIPQGAMESSSKMKEFLINTALGIIIKNKFEIIILLSKSKGSKYENAYNEFVDFTTESLDKSSKESNIELNRVIAKAAINAEIDILESFVDDEEKIKSLSLEFLDTVFRHM